MPLAVLLAVDEDRDALEDVESHLVRRSSPTLCARFAHRWSC
jgi:hypothetical protein